MYVHLSSGNHVPANGLCSFRTVMSEDVCCYEDGKNTEMEVALVSWQYYGQKFSLHFKFRDERMIELKNVFLQKSFVCSVCRMILKIWKSL